MDLIVEYFSEMRTSHRSLLLVGGLTLFFLIENVFPFFRQDYNKWKHSGMNLFFTLTTVLVNFSMAFLLVASTIWVTDNRFGLINWWNVPLWAQVIFGLLLMDLIGAYLAHWVQHNVQWMWKFHLIHHTDQHLDTTSANRHHPGESVIRFGFTILAVFIVGAPVWLIFLYQSASLLATQFNHSNMNIPEKLDSALSYIIATPRMHRVHHHYREPYSNTNYGNIFSFWDRIFGTFRRVDNNKLVYGLDTHMDVKETESIWELLKIPFVPYRDRIEYEEEEKL